MPLLTADVATILGISQSQVRHLRSVGMIDATKIGRDWHYDRQSVEKAKSRNTKAGWPLGKVRKIR